MVVIEQLVEQIEARFADAQREMSDPEIFGDRRCAAAAGRSFRQLEAAAKLAEQWRRAVDDEAGARELLAEGEDPEAHEMLGTAQAGIERLEQEIRLALVERDPNDDKNVIVEIRGAAGGDEAGIWAGDLFRMLTKYAERLGFAVETLAVGGGAFTFAIKGNGAYSIFKFEGGSHKVQCVPVTESQGRTHTSTATVAVLPEAEDVDVEINDNDLQIDVYRSSGAGGQSVNTTDSAVRITHNPTGLVVSMQDDAPLSLGELITLIDTADIGGFSPGFVGGILETNSLLWTGDPQDDNFITVGSELYPGLAEHYDRQILAWVSVGHRLSRRASRSTRRRVHVGTIAKARSAPS